MIIFLDTMIYLHYQSLEEINFIDLFNTDIVKIIIPRITIKELDKEKNINSSDKIKKRAKRSLDKIEKLLKTNSKIRDKEYLEYYNQTPNIDFKKISLDPNWNDDYLIASIVQYKIENPNENEIYLITQDTGIRLSAMSLGISVFEMPEKYKLPIEISEIEAENKELKRKLEKINNALPNLVIFFSDSEDNTNRAVFKLNKPPDLNEKYVEDEINKVKLQYPKMVCPEPINKNNLMSIYNALLATSINPIPKEEFDRYNKEVDIYLEKYKEYLYKNYDNIVMAHRTISFELEIRNIGTAPAEDIDVVINFPDGFILCKEDDLPEIQEEPNTPQKPMSSIQKLANLSSNFTFSDNNLNRLPNISLPSSFSLKKTKSYELKDHFNRIKHFGFDVLPELFLIFDSYESAKSFRCWYKLGIENLPQPIIGELHFIIEKQEGKI